MLLASPFVTAGTQYPAADFKPKVLFQDTEYKHESSSSSNSSSVSLGEKTKPDANYPAATFQPEVLYHDTEYKHKKADIKSESIALTAWVDEEEDSEAAAAGEGSSMNPLFAIVVLGIAGFLYSKKSKGTAKTKASTESASGLTGVAKYLQNKTPKLSGVAKYLEENQPTPKSGVAKYVAQRVVEAKKAAANKTTGVEKYMRNQNRG